jgi:hypothetical protein
MEGYTKDDVIDKLNREYLEKVALKTNNAPRGAFLSYSDEKFRDYAKGKFTAEELTVVWQNFVLSNPPEKVAKRISHRSAHDLIDLYLSHDPADTYFVEHKISDSFCDLVLVEGEDYRTSAVEIKSNGDDLRRAVDQCERYAEWADTVTVLVETEKRTSTSEQLPEWVGVKVIGDDGDVTTVREATDLDQSPTQLVDLMTVDQLKQLLRTIGERVSGRKNELLERVNAHINEIPEPTVRRTLVLG